MKRVAKKKAKMEALRRAREWGAEDRDRRSLRIDVPRTGTVHVSVKEEDAHDSKNCSWYQPLFVIAFYLIVAHCSIVCSVIALAKNLPQKDWVLLGKVIKPASASLIEFDFVNQT